MPPETNEVDKFFAGLPTKEKKVADIFGDNPAPVETPAGTSAEEAGSISPEKEEEGRKNRRHRRLEAQLESERKERQSERDARLKVEARLSAIESGSKGNETVDERLVRLYGPDNAEASRLHMELLNDYANKAEERAFERIKKEGEREAEERRKTDEYLDSQFEAIEDEFGVDITSDSPAARKARNGLIDLVEKLSPKDESGEIAEFADFHAAWEVYQENANKPSATTARAKEIASGTMNKSGTGQPAPKAPSPGFYGWKKDFGIG